MRVCRFGRSFVTARTGHSVGRSGVNGDTTVAYRVIAHPLLSVLVTRSGPCLRPFQPQVDSAREIGMAPH
jgi:hypothetical protein